MSEGPTAKLDHRRRGRLLRLITGERKQLQFPGWRPTRGGRKRARARPIAISFGDDKHFKWRPSRFGGGQRPRVGAISPAGQDSLVRVGAQLKGRRVALVALSHCRRSVYGRRVIYVARAARDIKNEGANLCLLVFAASQFY